MRLRGVVVAAMVGGWMLVASCGDEIGQRRGPSDSSGQDDPGGAADVSYPGDVDAHDKPDATMVDVAAGPFQMGCNEAVDTDCLENEFPYHVVDVPAFSIDVYEVTEAEYRACVAAGGCTGAATGGSCNYGVAGRGTHPINCVTLGQARAYCAWAGKRLPSEAQWEKAARGTDGRRYPWGNQAPDCDHAVIAWQGCPQRFNTEPVGSKPLGVSPYGAHDLAGNVWEWVEDAYHDTYAGAPTDGSAWPGPEGAAGVVRGGSWSYYFLSNDLRVSLRHDDVLDDWNGHVGFRCAR